MARKKKNKQAQSAIDEIVVTPPAIPEPVESPVDLAAAANEALNAQDAEPLAVQPPVEPQPAAAPAPQPVVTPQQPGTAAEPPEPVTQPESPVIEPAGAGGGPTPGSGADVETAPVDRPDLFFTGADDPGFDFGVPWDDLAPALQGFLSDVASGNAEFDPFDTSTWWRDNPPPGFPFPIEFYDTLTTVFVSDSTGSLIPILQGDKAITPRGSVTTFLPPPWLPQEILDVWPTDNVTLDDIRQIMVQYDLSDRISGQFTDLGNVSEESLNRLRQVFGALTAENPELALRQGLFDSLLTSISADIAANRNPNPNQLQQLSDLLSAADDSPTRLEFTISEFNRRFEAATGQSAEGSALASMTEQLRGFWDAGRMDLVEQVKAQIETFLTETAPQIGTGTGGGGDLVDPGKDPLDLGGGGDGVAPEAEAPEFDIDTFIAGFTESLSGLGISDEEKESIRLFGRDALTQKLSGLSASGLGQSSFVGDVVSEVAADMEDRFAGAEMEAKALGTQIALQASNLLLGEVEFDEGLRLAQIEMANDVFLKYESMNVAETLGLAENEMREAFYSGKLDVEKTAIMMEHWARMVGLEYDRDRIRVGLEAVRAQSGFDWTTFVMGMAGTAIQTYSLTRGRDGNKEP